MEINKNVKWLCEHSSQLEKFSGKWVYCQINEGVVANGRSLDIVLKNAKKKKLKNAFVFHVPKKENLLLGGFGPPR